MTTTTSPAPPAPPVPFPSYNIFNAFISCLKRYAKFSGRACRSEYWYWILSTCLVGLLPLGIDIAYYGLEALLNDTTPISDIYNLLTLIPGLAVFVRRMHDSGRSAWNLLWYLLPFIGWIVIIVFCCRQTAEANKYGDGPDAPAA